MKKFTVLVMGLVSLGAMAGCDDDSKSVKVPAAVQAAFGEMFPAASHVEWEDKGGYMVADFRSAGTVMQAFETSSASLRCSSSTVGLRCSR